ncbi:hypothetical protein MRX96_053016, partial [Rhipicephalus microplus]
MLLLRGRWTYNTMMMNRQTLQRVKKAGTPSTTGVVESPDMNRSGTLMASMVLTTRDNGPDYENIQSKAHLHQEDVHESALHRDPENDSKQDPAPVQGTVALQAPSPVL